MVGFAFKNRSNMSFRESIFNFLTELTLGIQIMNFPKRYTLHNRPEILLTFKGKFHQ